MEYIYIVNASYVYSTTFFIILHEDNENMGNETDLLEKLWKTFKFLDYFLISFGKSVRVTTYNPFFNKTITFNQKQQIMNCEIFADKLKDLNGYAINVALFEDPPRIVLSNGKYEGRNIRIMNLAMEKMNASANIIVPEQINGSYFSGSNIAIVARTIDISFMDHFTTKILGKNQSYSYPHGMDDFIVIVLKGSEVVNYFNVYEIFDWYTWMCTLIAILAITFYRRLIEQRDPDISSSFLHVWAIFNGVTLASTFNTQRKVKIVFLAWTLGCLVLNIIFSSLLASKIIKPKLRRNIDTIEELRKLNPKIYMSHKFFDSIPKEYGISKNLIPASHLERYEAVNNLDERTATVIATTVFELIEDRSHLHVLSEHLLPGFTMFRFQTKSPFKKKIDDIIFRVIEHGLTNYNKNFTVKRNIRQQSHETQTVLRFEHLKHIFSVFVIGHTFAAVAFILEILVEFYYKHTYIYRHYFE